MRFRTVILILAVVAAGLFGWRLLAPHGGRPTAADTEPTAPVGSDYYMRDATVYEMNEHGQRIYRMQIERTLHYPNDSVRLHGIRVHYEAGTGSGWFLQADHGRIPPDSHDIHLTGGVTLRHPNAGGQTTVVQTDHVWIRTQKEIIETPAHATAVSPHRVIEGDGLRIDRDDSRLKILHNVRSRYTP